MNSIISQPAPRLYFFIYGPFGQRTMNSRWKVWPISQATDFFRWFAASSRGWQKIHLRASFLFHRPWLREERGMSFPSTLPPPRAAPTSSPTDNSSPVISTQHTNTRPVWNSFVSRAPEWPGRAAVVDSLKLKNGAMHNTRQKAKEATSVGGTTAIARTLMMQGLYLFYRTPIKVKPWKHTIL